MQRDAILQNSLRAVVERLSFVAPIYRNLRDQLDQRQPAIKTPWGFSFAGHKAMAQGSFEPEETAIVRHLLQEVDILVNVGANVGYYCCHALSMGKHVIAVEPIARNLHYLMKNIRNNGWADRAEIYPVAVGSGTNVLEIWGGGTGASLIKGWAGNPKSYVTQVPVLCLDRILGEQLHGKKALILVDIEGSEYMMLQGASRVLINEPRPIWLMEVSKTEHQPAGTAMNPYFAHTFERFFETGYRAVTADAHAAAIDRGTIQRVVAGKETLRTHNFVFSVEETFC